MASKRSGPADASQKVTIMIDDDEDTGYRAIFSCWDSFKNHPLTMYMYYILALDLGALWVKSRSWGLTKRMTIRLKTGVFPIDFGDNQCRPQRLAIKVQ